MTDAEMLAMLETDLEIVTDYMDSTAKTAKETELTQYINAAKVYITREGVTLDLADPGDARLVCMYASWLYRARKVPDITPMPRHLRWNLNNRLYQQKIREAT